MWTRFRQYCPGATTWRRMLLAAGAAGLLVLAFCCGRMAVNQATAQTGLHNPFAPATLPASQASYTGSDSYRRPVAYIYHSIPIMREDLGEYLIARFGEDRIEFLVNRRIIEQACTAKSIVISDAQVEAQFVEDLRQMQVGLEAFVNQVLRRFNKTLYEYKEDVIRPKLAMREFCKELVAPTPDDLQKAFEAHYGPKVECRMIILAKETQPARRDEIWHQCRASESGFDKNARDESVQFIKDLAVQGGRVPPIHKHFGDINIERAAFGLKPGEVSEVFEMSDHTSVILRCEKHVAADTSHNFETERMKLYREVEEVKLTQEIPRVFAQLKQNADPEIFLKKDPAQEAQYQRRLNEQLVNPNLAKVQKAGMPPVPAIQPAGGAVPPRSGPAVQQTGFAVQQLQAAPVTPPAADSLQTLPISSPTPRSR